MQWPEGRKRVVAQTREAIRPPSVRARQIFDQRRSSRAPRCGRWFGSSGFSGSGGFGLALVLFATDIDFVRLGLVEFDEVIIRLGQLLLIQQQLAESVAGAQLKHLVHLDRVERADLDAYSATHANR